MLNRSDRKGLVGGSQGYHDTDDRFFKWGGKTYYLFIEVTFTENTYHSVFDSYTVEEINIISCYDEDNEPCDFPMGALDDLKTAVEYAL